MAKQKRFTGNKDITWDPGEANPKQLEFFESRTMFTAYGGAKGGGKTWAVRTKAIGGALFNPGIRILIMRCHYPELEENHIRPIVKAVPPELAAYNGTTHLMSFHNGSTIKFGHWSGDESESEYNGLEYDWIFIDEATQFSERAFNFLGGCMRGVNEFPKRMYLTCNPGGIGHNWVKRLFVDRNFRTYPDDPERDEHPEHYSFIFASVDDNPKLLETAPNYLKNLANMPEDVRRAYRYGDWSILGGNYFKEFTPMTHTMKPFKVPEHWTLYRSFDYGLDMFACFWWAVDEDGRCWGIREFEHKGLIVQDAAEQILTHTLPNEKIAITYAPPDIWSRTKDTGRTMAEQFALCGVPVVKADNNRIQGHMMMKDMLAPIPLKDPFVKSLFPEDKCPDKLPALMFFDGLGQAISDIQDIQADQKNPNDCAKSPHEVTHTVDACVTADTMILTPAGSIPIGEIKSAGECYAWDGEKIVVCEHSPAFMTREKADVYEIELDTGEKIRTTAEHRVLTVAGWMRIDELTEDDEILNAGFSGDSVCLPGLNNFALPD